MNFNPFSGSKALGLDGLRGRGTGAMKPTASVAATPNYMDAANTNAWAGKVKEGLDMQASLTAAQRAGGMEKAIADRSASMARAANTNDMQSNIERMVGDGRLSRESVGQFDPNAVPADASPRDTIAQRRAMTARPVSTARRNAMRNPAEQRGLPAGDLASRLAFLRRILARR